MESAGMELFFMEETMLAGEASGDIGAAEADEAEDCALVALVPVEEGDGRD